MRFAFSGLGNTVGKNAIEVSICWGHGDEFCQVLRLTRTAIFQYAQKSQAHVYEASGHANGRSRVVKKGNDI